MQTPSNVGDCGGGNGVNTEDHGVPTPNNPHTTLNFTGAVTVVDSGGGVATINIGTVTNTDQAFTYVAAGTETATFVLTLPAARATANYIAMATDGGRIDGTLSFFVCPVSGYTTTTIQVKCTQAPAAGDKINFFVTDKV